MAGKGGKSTTSRNGSIHGSSGGGKSSSTPGTSTSGGSGRSANAEPEYNIISGWEHSMYAHKSDRYAYLGKDEDTGEPEWIDWGSKSGSTGGGKGGSKGGSKDGRK